MKILTDEQLLFLQSLKTDEYKAMQLQAQADLRKAQAEQEEKMQAYWAQKRAEEAASAALIEKLEGALRAAGIQLRTYGGYDYTGFEFELADGTKGNMDGYDIDTFDEESK
jgi:hypothetical protein